MAAAMNMEIEVDIITCECEHAFQDRRYGIKQRLATVKANGAKCCTVCGKNTAAPEYNRKKK